MATSRMITSYARCSAAMSADPPSAAASTLKPSAASDRSSILRTGPSSSATSKRSAGIGSTSVDVTAYEQQSSPQQRRDSVERANPCGPEDGLPIDRCAQKALPGVELAAQEVGPNGPRAGQDPDQIEQERDHERRDDRRRTVASGY